MPNSRIDQIETTVEANIRELNRAVPINKANIVGLIIFAAYLETAAAQIRKRVSDFRDRQGTQVKGRLH